MNATMYHISDLVENVGGFCKKHNLRYTHGGNIEEYWFKIQSLNEKFVERYCVRWSEAISVSEAAAWIMVDVIDKFGLNKKKETATYDKYCYNDLVSTLKYAALTPKSLPEIEKVIFNNPATIVFWSDNTKTVVKVQEGDIYDPEKGLSMAICKKVYGNKSSYCNVLKRWLKKYEVEEPQTSAKPYVTIEGAFEEFARGAKKALDGMSKMQKRMVIEE